MFFKKTMDDVYKTKHTLVLTLNRLSEIEKSCTSHENFKNETLQRLERFANKIEEMDKTIQAICECIRKDRTDITGLCQIVKKIETKRKK